MREPLALLDLFSGIGGFSLGLERSGYFKPVAFCEIEPYPRRVLAKHWPKVPCYDDVRTLSAGRLAADGIRVDAICGGFPCQDISLAGSGAGLAGERSGLWFEYHRLIGELRPEVVVVENVAALLGRGLSVVLGALAALGYDAQWHCIPASALGAPHQRDRIWIIAYAGGQQHEGRGDAICRALAEELSSSIADDDGQRKLQSQGMLGNIRRRTGDGSWWASEPALDRVVYGVPDRMERLRGLGNAVVPQIPEAIGRAIGAAMFGSVLEHRKNA